MSSRKRVQLRQLGPVLTLLHAMTNQVQSKHCLSNCYECANTYHRLQVRFPRASSHMMTLIKTADILCRGYLETSSPHFPQSNGQVERKGLELASSWWILIVPVGRGDVVLGNCVCGLMIIIIILLYMYCFFFNSTNSYNYFFFE